MAASRRVLDDRQLVVRLVIGEREAAAAKDIAKRKVSPFHVDAGAVHASAGDVRKPSLPVWPRSISTISVPNHHKQSPTWRM
jgi:hypothetical protein